MVLGALTPTMVLGAVTPTMVLGVVTPFNPYALLQDTVKVNEYHG